MDGFLYGFVDKHGQFTGSDITFVYQDLLTGLTGSFVNGVLQWAHAVDVVAERCNNGIKELRFEPAMHSPDITWTKHEPNETYIGQHPTVMDPYEEKSIYFAESSIPTAEHGLFANRIFSPGDLVSYYSGQKTYLQNILRKNMTREQKEVASAYNFGLGKYSPQHWGYPDNLIIDIGLAYRNASNYRTTLAHKANHKFAEKNGVYDVVDHPVVGGIACIVAAREIDIGDEIFVDYNYDLGQGVPEWYRDALNHHVMEEAIREVYQD